MTDSWWLKFKRAQRHMVEIRHVARLYAKRHPYEISRIREPKGKDNVWRYRLTFEPPDPMLVVMLGDFIHNLRSALDHVAVACAPRKYRTSASFPLAAKDLFALDDNGNFIEPDDDARKHYLRMIRGMSFRVKAMIAEVQPYRRSPQSDVFRILNVLDNADKHRGLIAIGAGLRGASISIEIRGTLHSTHTIGSKDFFYDGAQVFSFTVVNPRLTDSEVNVKCSGSATISVKVARIDGQKGVLDFPVQMTILKARRDVRFVLRQLEKHVIQARGSHQRS